MQDLDSFKSILEMHVHNTLKKKTMIMSEQVYTMSVWYFQHATKLKENLKICFTVNFKFFLT